MITQDVEETPAIEEEVEEKNEAEKPEEVIKTDPEPEKEEVIEEAEPEPEPEPEPPKVNERALYKGNSNTDGEGSNQGETGQPGDQGQPDGTPDATNYQGSGGLGDEGRVALWSSIESRLLASVRPMTTPTDYFNQAGGIGHSDDRRRAVVAMATDEHGGVAGLVTLEDLTETMLGVEILDESDQIADLRAAAVRLRDGRLERLKRLRLLSLRKPENEGS